MPVHEVFEQKEYVIAVVVAVAVAAATAAAVSFLSLI